MFLPVAVSIAAYGLVWGVLAGQAGLSVLEVALMSGLVFAGASQFVALDMWTPGALPVLSIVIAAGIVNLRMLLMSATLRPLVGHLSLPRQLGAMFFVSDEQWAMTMAEVRKGKGSVAFLIGTGVLSWFAWMSSTLCGRVLGAFIDDPTRYGLDFAFTATFLALLLGMWRGRGDLVPWIVGALAAILTSRLIEGNWYIIVGGLVGSFAGALAETLKERRHVA
ncbi:MAG TPA: AzlC family ABC transporter permease [Devosia sp.]|uniref:AzlC family ABC transporter permease n=1 Tax=Devosia sp. TaxID=1871048 RepID=UPI002DDD7549|nr:AzlC family ABC transporter permease [Devosia sp.]HEV2514471.1 AzlC family ABC transporter permease [Devosia sp.]